MVVDEERLERLRTKAEEAGFTFNGPEKRTACDYKIWIGSKPDLFPGKGLIILSDEENIDTVETLLAALAPGPVVTIRRHAEGWCHTNCDLSPKYLCIHQTGHSVSGTHEPTETCPGPAPDGYEWRMVLLPVKKEVEDG